MRSARVRVEESRSSLQSSRGRGKLVEALLALKKSGRLPGVYGRLGDLGAIDDKYDVAISTACGALDNIVVSTGVIWKVLMSKKGKGKNGSKRLRRREKMREGGIEREREREDIMHKSGCHFTKVLRAPFSVQSILV